MATAESTIRRDLRDILISEGYVIFEARDFQEVLEEIETGHIDLVLLDAALPGTDGCDPRKQIGRSSSIPVLLLGTGAQTGNPQVVEGGTSQDIVRPFASDHLIACTREALRNEPAVPLESKFDFPSFRIDFARRRISIDDRIIHLTPKEMTLLRHLVLNQGHPVPHVKLLQAVWGSDDFHRINELRVFVNQLRRKIEPDLGDRHYSHIQTDNFIGYHFEPNPGKPKTRERSRQKRHTI